MAAAVVSNIDAIRQSIFDLQDHNNANFKIINFTQSEVISFQGRKTLRLFDDLFEVDADGYSRWNAADDIQIWSEADLVNTCDLTDFQDVYGYLAFNHIAGFKSRKVYTTDESRNAYYNR